MSGPAGKSSAGPPLAGDTTSKLKHAHSAHACLLAAAARGGPQGLAALLFPAGPLISPSVRQAPACAVKFS
eukprot:CAMPEP_0171079024 /NCGR_PEP_ID=MMETSP0766_2-20121228/14998_1 /TAXON_ID=439317 /ORGANISM="Gambierdiscus australes, Strain CAWD 149" /LENGTH=70 /DNA_ID=CAMNT_0011536187 /DNA_START=1 /DNA_END=209 /DNA_ORIENTATION=+